MGLGLLLFAGATVAPPDVSSLAVLICVLQNLHILSSLPAFTCLDLCVDMLTFILFFLPNGEP